MLTFILCHQTISCARKTIKGVVTNSGLHCWTVKSEQKVWKSSGNSRNKGKVYNFTHVQPVSRPLPSTVTYCSGQSHSQRVTETAQRYPRILTTYTF
jgi:hypothetical protein